MRTAWIAAAAIAVAAIATPEASAWRSNEWVSPTGNIHCEFLGAGTGVTCMQRQTRRQAVVGQWGPAYEVYRWPDPFVTYRYVLVYGRQWSTSGGRYFCRSLRTHMVCGNRWTGHGFTIAREGIRTW